MPTTPSLETSKVSLKRALASFASLTAFTGFTACTAVLLVSSSAAATPSRVRLRVIGAEDCIHTPALARDVDGILRRNAIDSSSESPNTPILPNSSLATIAVAVGLDRQPGAFKAVLTLQSPDGSVVGTREVVRRGSSCAVLDGPLAVVTALLVDAAEDTIHLVLPAPPPPEASAPDTLSLARAPIPSSSPPASSLATARSAPWTVRNEIAGTVLAGPLPTAVGARVDAFVAPPNFAPILVRLDVFPHTTTSGSGPGGEFLALAGSLGFCPERDGRVVRLDVCVGGTVGFIRASGRNVPFVGESTAPYAMLFAEGGAAVHLAGPLALRGAVAVAGGFRPSDWHVDAPRTEPVVVWDPWPVALVGSLGIVIETTSATKSASGT